MNIHLKMKVDMANDGDEDHIFYSMRKLNGILSLN